MPPPEKKDDLDGEDETLVEVPAVAAPVPQPVPETEVGWDDVEIPEEDAHDEDDGLELVVDSSPPASGHDGSCELVSSVDIEPLDSDIFGPAASDEIRALVNDALPDDLGTFSESADKYAELLRDIPAIGTTVDFRGWVQTGPETISPRHLLVSVVPSSGIVVRTEHRGAIHNSSDMQEPLITTGNPIEYVMTLIVPTHIQEQQGVLCEGGACKRLENLGIDDGKVREYVRRAFETQRRASGCTGLMQVMFVVQLPNNPHWVQVVAERVHTRAKRDYLGRGKDLIGLRAFIKQEQGRAEEELEALAKKQ